MATTRGIAGDRQTRVAATRPHHCTDMQVCRRQAHLWATTTAAAAAAAATACVAVEGVDGGVALLATDRAVEALVGEMPDQRSG